DTGIGIRPEILPFVFDRFRQADSSSTRAHGGLGLGLAIVRNLVDWHGGAVSARSGGVGKGATFTVTFPVETGSVRSIQTRRATPGRVKGGLTADGVQTLTGRVVLVVDDHADARELAREIIQNTGAKVLTAATTREALDILTRSMTDVIVADIGLPEEDGCDLIRRVRDLQPERGGRLPAIALTAYAHAEDRARALAAGFQQYLVKPVDPDALVRAVTRALAINSPMEV
ncbi:MAG TPA: response regulator, partial [Vicinamibacterales bacterium]|nr:response regulator [Vicinamibacterales bacterium]